MSDITMARAIRLATEQRRKLEAENEQLREALDEAWVQYGYCSAASVSVEDKDAAWKRLGQILAPDGLRRKA